MSRAKRPWIFDIGQNSSFLPTHSCAQQDPIRSWLAAICTTSSYIKTSDVCSVDHRKNTSDVGSVSRRKRNPVKSELPHMKRRKSPQLFKHVQSLLGNLSSNFNHPYQYARCTVSITHLFLVGLG